MRHPKQLRQESVGRLEESRLFHLQLYTALTVATVIKIALHSVVMSILYELRHIWLAMVNRYLKPLARCGNLFRVSA